MPLNDKDYLLLTIIAVVVGVIGAAAITIVIAWGVFGGAFGGYGQLAVPLIGLPFLIIYLYIVFRIISKHRARRK
ncbi:hypothetical protein ACFLVR_00670 [Chloroflexota bacterium]